MKFSYGWEKMYSAVRGMAAGTDRLQDRLRDALIFHLIHVGAENVPPDVWPKLQDIRARLTREPAVGDEGTAHATARILPDDEAREIANIIVDCYDETSAAYRGVDD